MIYNTKRHNSNIWKHILSFHGKECRKSADTYTVCSYSDRSGNHSCNSCCKIRPPTNGYRYFRLIPNIAGSANSQISEINARNTNLFCLCISSVDDYKSHYCGSLGNIIESNYREGIDSAYSFRCLKVDRKHCMMKSCNNHKKWIQKAVNTTDDPAEGRIKAYLNDLCRSVADHTSERSDHCMGQKNCRHQ